MSKRLSLTSRFQAFGIGGSLLVSGAALASAPLLMPEPYSWLSHTTSESAAQGLEGAWLARFGFLAFGLAVLWLASHCQGRWGGWATLSHGSFGVLMLATAVFSHRPFLPGQPFDAFEDALHSGAATAMGFAFAFGVLMIALTRRRHVGGIRVLDAAALAASVAIPLGMLVWTGVGGLLQRAMFLIAYVWYATEAFESE